MTGEHRREGFIRPDRLGQERDKKRSKTLLTIAGVLIALNVLIFLFVPTQRSISYDEDAVIYSVSDESYEKPCHVTLEGTLTQSVLLKDSFYGTLYVTDVPGMDEAMTLRLTRQDGAWEGYLYDWAGQILATGVWDVEATKDFADITIAFATTFEINGNQRHAGFDRDNATFLSLGAPNRAYALRKYQELILKQK